MIFKPDIILTAIDKLGLDIKKTGQNYKGLCPFHSEKTPSFVISPAKQIYKCFGGCGSGGDVYNLVMKYHGCTFAEAKIHLGIAAGIYKPDPITIRKRELQKIYRQWTHEYCLILADLLRWLDEAKTLCETIDEVERWAENYHEQSTWELEYRILLSNDEESKFELFRSKYNAHKYLRQRS